MNQPSDMEGIAGGMAGPGPSGLDFTTPSELKKRLNTAIYDYFIKNGGVDLAEMMVKNKANFELETSPPDKSNNGRQINGESMNIDSKDETTLKRIQNLPVPSLPYSTADTCFLSDWWTVFFEMFSAQRTKKPGNVGAYLMHNQMAARARQQPMMRPGMGPQFQMNGMPNGMANGADIQQSLQRKAMAQPGHRSMPNNGAMRMQPMQAQQQMQMNPTNMQRDGSEQQRPSSPMSGDNAPSPKRPRTEGSFNGGQMGRAQVPGMNMANGNGAGAGTQAGKQAGHTQYAMTMAAAHRQTMNNPATGNVTNAGSLHGSPMMGQGPNPSEHMDFYAGGGQVAGRGPITDPAAGQGQNALHDYQVQLILLEQQNKRRLIQARNEQEQGDGGRPQPSMTAGQMAPMGMAGFNGVGMSPQGSRTGQSPNPDSMKRSTPKMGTNSPLPDGSMPGRSSPVPMNFEGGQLQPGAGNQYFNMMRQDGMGMNPNVMRPPGMPTFMNGNMNPGQMEMLRARAMPNGMMPGQMHPMGPQGQVQQSQETPQQRSAMPPPQAPQAAGNGRTQPSSPSQPAAPPTPSQTNKANPKKKEAKETKKKPAKKAAASAAVPTPSADAEEPPTPTPQTPITPVHPKSFNQNTAGNQSGNGQNQASTEAASQGANTAGQQDSNANNGQLSSMDGTTGLPFDGGVNMDFSALDNADVLDGFDFSEFLNPTAEGGNFDFNPSSFDPSIFEVGEAGTGE